MEPPNLQRYLDIRLRNNSAARCSTTWGYAIAVATPKSPINRAAAGLVCAAMLRPDMLECY
jgi:hypothetical protein